ncbi:MAG: GNAT family N-acetyltransferase [Verrucomicrobia bacterium]|nr:GNAT family N-acetyltransferase [Verrucomicrobiota bacterium]
MTEPVPPPLLRVATPSDDPFLLALYQTTRGAEPGWAALPNRARDALLASQFHLQIASYARDHPDLERYVVEIDGQPVGRLDVERSPDAVLLVEIALLPDARHRGIGGTLVRGLQNEARDKGLPVRLHVWHDTGAAAFYQRLGFKITAPGSQGDRMEWSPAG